MWFILIMLFWHCVICILKNDTLVLNMQGVHRFTDYQYIIIFVMIFMDLISSGLVIYFCYCLFRFSELRKAAAQAIQDGDEIFHWSDAKNITYLVAGLLCGLFTMNLGCAFAFAQMFQAEHIVFITVFAGATFTLLGIAWKK